MQCLECNTTLERLDNLHLLECCGLTVQEYALRHHTPLDLMLHPDQINETDPIEHYESGKHHVSEQARAVLEGLRMAGLVCEEDGFTVVPGEIRRLEQLLWDLEALHEYGFQFRQEYVYTADTHRVIARNRLKVPTAHLRRRAVQPAYAEPPELLDTLAVFLAHVGELQSGYVFLSFPKAMDARCISEHLQRDHDICLITLPAAEVRGDGVLLRTHKRSDSEALLKLLATRLEDIPGAYERFYECAPEATVVKELVFDAAHFISDHPAKCTNLHGGRYLLHVKVHDRIDPITGCVVDFGYLKRVANRLVIERFDHHNLNYADSDLAWRSSAELLCVHIWEQLIGYLPGLTELTLYETPQSWCNYAGPTLEQFQEQGSSKLLSHFVDPGLGGSSRRGLIRQQNAPMLELIGQG